MFKPFLHVTCALALTTSLCAQQPGADKLPQGAILRLHYPDGFNCAALSRDGKVLAVATGMKVIALDPHTGKTLWSHDKLAHPVGIRCLAFTTDSKTLTAGGDFNVLRFFDAGTGKETVTVRPMEGRNDWSAIAMSPDGKHMVTSSIQGMLGFWDIKTGKQIRQPTYPAASIIMNLDFSPDSKRLAVSSRGSSKIHFWDPDQGKDAASIQPPFNGPEHATFCPDGKLLAFTCPNHDSSIALWDLATAREIRKVGGNRNGGRLMESFAFSPDGRSLVASQINDPGAYLFETSTAQERVRFVGHRERVYLMAFAANGRSLLTCGAEKTLILWDLTGAWREGKYHAEKLGGEELGRLWASLGTDQADGAYRSIWKLALSPEQSVPFLRDRFFPGGAPAVAPDLAKPIADLGDQNFQVREKALADLKRLGVTSEKPLRDALAGNLSAEAKARIRSLLPDGSKQPAGPTRLHWTRALEALELAATPAAREIMEELARGHTEDWITEEARIALRRWRP